MQFADFTKLLKAKTQTILTLMLIATMLTVVFSLLSPLKYGVKSRLLVAQDSASSDAYTLSRSNEYLGKILAEVVYSGSFYDRVIASQYNVDKTYFSGDYRKQMEKWNKTVNTRTKQDTGIIEVNVYHPNTTEARKIALAINDILVNENQAYHGGKLIKINIIDQPLTSTYPVKPNIIFNTIAALGLSFIFALFFVYIFPEDKYSIYLFASAKDSRAKTKSAKVIKSGKETKTPSKEPAKKEVVTEKDADEDQLRGNIANVIR